MNPKDVDAQSTNNTRRLYLQMAILTYVYVNPTTEETVEVDANTDQEAELLMFGLDTRYYEQDWILADVY